MPSTAATWLGGLVRVILVITVEVSATPRLLRKRKQKLQRRSISPQAAPSSSELDASRGVQSMSLHSNPVLCRTQHVTHKRSQGPRPFAFLPWKAMTSQALPAAETVDYLLITENIRDQEKCRKAKGMRRPVEETHETLQAGASLVHFLS